MGHRQKVLASPSGASPTSAGNIRSTCSFPRGGLFPACGKLYRLAKVLPDGGILIDKAPVAPPAGITFRGDSLVIPVDGIAEVETSRIALESIEATAKPPRARLLIREVEFAKGSGEPPTKTENRTVDLAAGAKFTLARKTYLIAGIVAPDAARGLRGWVEIVGEGAK